MDLSDVDQYTTFMDLPHSILSKRNINFKQCLDRFEELKEKIFEGDELMTCAYVMFFTNVFNDSKLIVNQYADFFLKQIVEANLTCYVDFASKGFYYCSATENLNYFVLNRFANTFRQTIIEGFKKTFKNHKQVVNYLILMFYMIMVYRYAFEYNSTTVDVTSKYFAIKFIEFRRNKIISKNDYNMVLSEIFYISKMLYQTVKKFETEKS